MQRKVWLECLNEQLFSSFGTFPFFQGYRYALPDSIRQCFCGLQHCFKDKLKSDYYLRLPVYEDQKSLEEILISYGASNQNYEDLEVCSADILTQVASNIVTAPHHGYYVCFVICDLTRDSKVIGFLQLDLYSLAVITSNLEQFFLPEINKWLGPDLRLTANTVRDISLSRLKQYLEALDGKQVLGECQKIFNSLGLVDVWLSRQKFVLEAFKSYKMFYKKGKDSDVIANLSYIILPDYHKRGIMSNVIKSCAAYLCEVKELSVFKWLVGDRIACENTASINLLKGIGFETCAIFDVYYTEAYKTRRHPNGNFKETCQALVLPLQK